MKTGPSCVAVVVSTPDLTGASRMAYLIAKCFERHGSRVIAVCGERPESVESVVDLFHESGIPVFIEHGFRSLCSVGLILRLRKLFTDQKVSVVVSFTQMDVKVGGWAAYLAGCPFVVSGQSMTTFYGSRFAKAMKRIAYGFTVRRTATGYIATSDAVAREVRDGFRFGKCTIVPNGIDSGIFRAIALRRQAETHRNPGPLRVIMVGRLDIQKSQHLAIDAVKRCLENGVSVHLRLVGDVTPGLSDSKAYAMMLRDRVKEMGLEGSVSFVGWSNKIPEELGWAEVYLHTAAWEGWPLAVLEAMASGLAVVISEASGVPEEFECGVHGFVVQNQDVAEYARCLEEIARWPIDERSSRGASARELVCSHYDFSQIGDQFVQCVARFLDAGHQDSSREVLT